MCLNLSDQAELNPVQKHPIHVFLCKWIPRSRNTGAPQRSFPDAPHPHSENYDSNH